MASRDDRYGGWTVAGHNLAVYVGSASTERNRAFFFAPEGPPDEPPPGEAPEWFSGTVFEAELDEENERIVPIEDRDWVAETEDELRDIFDDIRDEIDADSLSEFGRERLSTSDSSTA